MIGSYACDGVTVVVQAGPKGNISAMIDVWTPIINFMESSRAICPHYPPWVSGNERHTYDALVAEGKRLWWYQSCMSEGCSSAVQPAHGSHPPGCEPMDTCVNGTWPSMMIDTEVGVVWCGVVWCVSVM